MNLRRGVNGQGGIALAVALGLLALFLVVGALILVRGREETRVVYVPQAEGQYDYDNPPSPDVWWYLLYLQQQQYLNSYGGYYHRIVYVPVQSFYPIEDYSYRRGYFWARASAPLPTYRDTYTSVYQRSQITVVNQNNPKPAPKSLNIGTTKQIDKGTRSLNIFPASGKPTTIPQEIPKVSAPERTSKGVTTVTGVGQSNKPKSLNIAPPPKPGNTEPPRGNQPRVPQQPAPPPQAPAPRPAQPAPRPAQPAPAPAPRPQPVAPRPPPPPPPPPAPRTRP